jgi:flavin-dependent dehydrogenase
MSDNRITGTRPGPQRRVPTTPDKPAAKGTIMDRREFSKTMLMAGMGVGAGSAVGTAARAEDRAEAYYEEPAQRLPVRKFDVVVTGGGTAGVVAAIAAA